MQNKIASGLEWIQQSAQFAAPVGKPLVLNGFGLVSQTNLNDFVPFNMTSPLYPSNTSVMSTTVTARAVTPTANFANAQQQQQGYSSFMSMGNSGGLAGVMAYQGTTLPGPSQELLKIGSRAAAPPPLPNDGYAIGTNPGLQQILEQGARAMAAYF